MARMGEYARVKAARHYTKEDTMKQFVLGLIFGSLLTGTVVGAGSGFYNKDGSLDAPYGSQKSYDYFRSRQQQLDIQHMRKQADQERLRQMSDPCGR
jgi:hypothetical protein